MMRLSPVLSPSFSVLCFLVLLGGCGSKALEQARQEAREAKVAVQQLKHSLGLAEKEIANMRAELKAVRQSRDELQESIDQANKERDKALGFAQQAQEAITAQSSGQVSATVSLQKQVAELAALVAEQQKLIDQLNKGEAVEPVALAPQGQTPPRDPNQD
jgi:predicted RNase H-like nuclease (RuvC/YqgF family)